jgi:hypothetical protein
MGALTEVEIFSCMAENFREAAELCEQLAWHPRRGHLYIQFLGCIRKVEGSCRQAQAHREDARWLRIGIMMGEVHRRAGGWVRGSRTRDERSQAHKLFAKLAENLRALHYEAEHLRTAAVERMGMILPRPLEGPHRDMRPVSVVLPSGLIVPPTVH